MHALPREYYLGDTVAIARDLLGKYLVRRYQGELLAVRITETEAYVGRCDKACHAYGYRKTPRNATMFGPPGHAYVYLIYGMHHCLNLVTEPEGEPSAVLIRGAQPVQGLETMARLRYEKSPQELTAYQKKHLLDGPGKLCRALALTRAQDGADLTGHTLWVSDDPGALGLSLPALSRPIVQTKRIGIDYAQEARDFLWRFTYGEIT